MARIDAFLKTIPKLGASGMTLRSDENIVLHFAAGNRHAAQKTPHDQLVALINNACPPDVQAALYMEQAASFQLNWQGVDYLIEVKPASGTLEVEMTQQAVPALH